MATSLRRRFTLSAALVATAMALLVGLISYEVAYRQAQRTAGEVINGLISAVQRTAAVGAYARDRVLLGEIASGLTRHPWVANVRIEQPGQAPIVQDAPGASAPDGVTPPFRQALISPFDPTETVGLLLIGANQVAISAAAREQAWWMALPMVLQVLVLTLALNGLAARLLSRPLTALSDKVRQLKPGTSERLALGHQQQDDEIGQVIVSTNRLLEASETALVSERQLRAEVQTIEARLRQLVNASSAAMFVLNPQGHLLHGNTTLVRICTGTAAELSSLAPDTFVEQTFEQPAQLRGLIEATLVHGQMMSADLRLRQRGDEDAEAWVHVLVSVLPGADSDGSDLIEGVMYDVTQRRHHERLAQHRAEHDALTGLRNRRSLESELERSLATASLQSAGLSLLYIDLDGFKQVNDQLGHAAGDEVLVFCAQRLLQIVRRSSDLVARLGGDEFVVLLHASLSEDWVGELAWRISRGLSEPIYLSDGRVAQVSASVGMAAFPEHGQDGDGLLRQADRAMYQIKRSGKNGVGLPPDAGRALAA
jgi:diguanylate cyclase (GGDEF)-like protein/PAS domain S-box-containing protein